MSGVLTVLLSSLAIAQGTEVVPTADCPELVSLATSEICGTEYGNHTIYLPDNVTKLSDFDNYVRDQTIFSYPPDCPNWQGEVVKTTFLPYAKSFTCAYLVWFTIEHGNSLKNNDKCALKNTANPPTQPPALCKSSVTRVFDAVKPNCDAPIFSKLDWNSFNDYSAVATDSNCYLAIGPAINADMKTCAMDDSAAYCLTNANALCCTSKTNLIAGSANATTTVAITTTKAVVPTVAAAPVATTTASAETGAVKPIFIVVAILGAGLVTILLVALMIFRKRNGRVSQQKGQVPSYHSQQNSIPTAGGALNDHESLMVCVFEYQSSLLDELDLEIGDRVRIIQKFDDGWALGLNLNTDKEGAFPFACVEPGISGVKSISNNKRVSSIYIPNDKIAYE
jgi:hypothetical protein